MSLAETAGFSCHGDTVFDPEATVLAYGQSMWEGSIRCDSTKDGVICTNTATNHGFRLRKVSWEIW